MKLLLALMLPLACLAQTDWFDLTRLKDYAAHRVSSNNLDPNSNDDSKRPLPGETLTLANLQGPGMVTHIWITVAANEYGWPRLMRLRVYYDGSEKASVDAPLGDLFAAGHGLERNLKSLMVVNSSSGRSRNFYWPMPFRRSCRITLTNEGRRRVSNVYYHVDWRKMDELPLDTAYFHAHYRQELPAEKGRMYNILNVSGRGHYVGTVLSVIQAEPGWFGEGDDIFTVDGRLAMVGTGTEDYFCDAWGLRVFDEPYFGCPVFEGREIGDRTSLYRFHIVDPIPFRRSFKFEIEHWPWISEFPNTGRDYFSSLGFWYQKGFHRPWPRLGRLVQAGPWDPARGRWHVAGALEAEDLGLIGFKSLKGEAGRPERLLLTPNQSGDHMLQFDSGGAGELTLAVPAEAEGTYDLKIHFLQAPDYGIVRLAVNGRPVGDAVDLYRAFAEMFPRPVWPPREYVFRGVALRAGVNELTFAVNGKNPESEGARIGIDCLVLDKTSGPAAPSRSQS